MENETLTNQILNLLHKLKCKLLCCCKSSCSLNDENNERLETIPEI